MNTQDSTTEIIEVVTASLVDDEDQLDILPCCIDYNEALQAYSDEVGGDEDW